MIVVRGGSLVIEVKLFYFFAGFNETSADFLGIFYPKSEN